MQSEEQVRRVLAPMVARGAELLDNLRPGWEKLIETGELCMESNCSCIIGQLYGNYKSGFLALLNRPTKEYPPWLLGFDLPWPEIEDVHVGNWAILDELWKSEITRRRKDADSE